MPQTRDCDYCGTEIEPGTGTMFVRVNGAVTHYCSAKCEKNAELDREPRDLEWTAAGRAGADKPAVADSQPEEEPPDASVEEPAEPDEAPDEPESPDEEEDKEE